MDRVEPIKLRYEDGTVYTLEFSRKTASDTEMGGFKRSEASDQLATMLPILFHGAFMMHHPNMKLAQTNKILYDDLGGLTPSMLDRLVDLYNAAFTTLLREDGTETKNSRVTVEM